MLKLLHTADIHLDCPFALEDACISKTRKNELREAFCEMMKFVREKDVKLLLIAGDLFEYEYTTKETVSLVVSEFERASGCEIVISPGNHDPYTDNSVYKKTAFPDNVHIFTKDAPECFSFPELNTDVYGYAFTKRVMERNPIAEHTIKNPDAVNILCAHADTSSPISKYGPLTEADIIDSRFDYIALGHIHNGTKLQKLGETYFAYSGCLEGRDFGECGYKGALVGEIEKDALGLRVNIAQKRFSRRRYAKETVECTGCHDISEVADKINEVIIREGYDDDTLLRVTLEGNVAPELSIMSEPLKALIRPIFSFSLEDKTVPLYDYENLIADPTIRGAILKRLLPVLTTGTAEEREIAAMALRFTLSSLETGDNSEGR